ncbi:DNA replication ATP-dependent helicase/nuclease JHS1-like [Coffea arabica]|uniref:DNA helicase n=1 Tax=Coffea arabica TaxID=13443 RepID=A0A6P6WDU1_COFAR
MAPRKKATTASKKSATNQNNHLHQQKQSQPSKFGIQHFFERHSQNQSQNPKKPINPSIANSNSSTISTVPKFMDGDPPVPPNASNDSASVPEKSGNESDSKNEGLSCENLRIGVNKEVGGVEKLEKETNKEGNELNNPSQITPTENKMPVVIEIEENPDEVREVSPEVYKGKPPKRFKFSPGMLIKQSQDDGGDEVTWKISPINERLHSMSKNFPEVVKVLKDSTRFNCLNFQQSSMTKTSPSAAGKLEKWLSSPPVKAAENSLTCSDRVSLRKHTGRHIVCKVENLAIRNSENNSEEVCSQSPFKTPPSLSYCHDKPHDGVIIHGEPDQHNSRPHKKALIELLDEVEDVISVEESVCDKTQAWFDIGRSINEPDFIVEQQLINSKELVEKEPSNNYFLVLEVSEKHGNIDSSGSRNSFKIMRVLNEQNGEEKAVHLWDEWFYSVVAPGDTVHIIGEFDYEGKCDVNHEKNFLIVHPDILVSGTRVAASFSCSRRTVLDERLKSNGYATAALVGTLLHQIFQAGLISESLSREFLEQYTTIVLQKNLDTLYACGVNEKDTRMTLVEAIPKILNWISMFRDSQGSRNQAVDFGCHGGLQNIKVSEVVDIEEMAWAPRYGLKGMIDASMRVIIDSNGHIEKIMPLELKTGKGTSGQTAMEHNAQVMLYTLLMSERYQKDINQGLLYYLHIDQTRGISVQRSDLVGLIIRRNDLAHDLLKALTTQELPAMQQSINMCRGCRHLDVCTIYHKAYGGTTESSGLGDMFDSLVQHLTTRDSLFLQKWNRLIDLEAKELEVGKKEIWISHILKNDLLSGRLSSLVLDTSHKMPQKGFSKGNQFVYRFVRQSFPLVGTEQQSSPSGLSSFDSTLRSGDYVILSTDPGHLPVANGVVMEVGSSHVSVSFSKRLRLPGSSTSVATDLSQQAWRIDKDEAMASFAIMRFNLVQLFLPNEQSDRVRKVIVNLEAPAFDSGCLLSQDPAISYIWSEKNLNDDQRRAILKILTTKDYALILGMPGTGKTSTMVHAVKALLLRGASILLTSYTNSAVDNLLIMLKAQGVDFIRIGRCEAVHEEVRGNCISAMDINSIEQIKLRLDQTRVVAVTCLGIASPLLTKKRFDYCIMDEAGQTTLPVSLGPLMFASKFVLVGDHYQLPPLVQSAEARENGMAISLFCRLSEAHPQAISALQSQYRMCAAIMELSNALIYGNRLQCGSAEIANAQLIYPCPSSTPEWLNEALNPERPVIFINTDFLEAHESNESKAVNNPVEACIVSEVINGFLERGIEGESIGVITPYNSQANLIRQAVSTSVEIHTIDKYQGRDKDCILVSFVRSSENPRTCCSSLLGDWHRINVAITRAKKKLIMVGCCRTLSRVPLLRLLIEKVEEQGGIMSISKRDIKLKPELKRCSSQLR